MEIEFNCKYIINIYDSKIKTIMKALKEILPKLLNEFVGKVLLMYAEEYMQRKEKPFECCKCGKVVSKVL